MTRHNPNGLAHAIVEAHFIDGDAEIEGVRVHAGQVLVTIRPGQYVHIHPSSSIADALDRIERYRAKWQGEG